ncbi:MAG: alpha/beta hydrolase [Candidatus Nanopelagicales bacterium]
MAMDRDVSEPGARDRAGRAWWWGVPALVLLAVVLAVVATRAAMLWANHPAYPLTLLAAAVLAGVVGGLGWRRRTRTTTPARIVGRVAGALALVVLAAGLWWLRSAPAEPVALDAVSAPVSSPAGSAGAEGAYDVEVTQSRTRIEFRPVSPDQPEYRPSTGWVFWPGALVDPRAYSALLRRVAADGVLVVVVKEPYDIGFLDPDAASSVLAAHPEVPDWYVGGHSLGGVVAASYAANHRDSVTGLVLWASYPAGDLSQELAGARVLSVSASSDGLTTVADVEESRANLAADTEFVVVEGAVHSYFGDYREQRGDGTPTVPRDVAQAEIVAVTAAFFTDAQM